MININKSEIPDPPQQRVATPLKVELLRDEYGIMRGMAYCPVTHVETEATRDSLRRAVAKVLTGERFE